MLHLISLVLASSLVLSPSEPAEDAVIKAQLPTYPLSACVISGEAFEGGEAVNVVADGRLVRVCCKRCAGKVTAAPAEYIQKVDSAVIAAQARSYPLKTCIKNPGERLSGDAVDTVVGTRLVRTCCGNCARKVVAEPAEYMKRLDAAYIEQQRATYAMDVCVVSGEALEDGAKDVLYGNTLVRLCCKGCKREFAKDPASFAHKVAMAGKAHGDHGHGDGHGHDGDRDGHHGDGDGHGHDGDGDHGDHGDHGDDGDHGDHGDHDDDHDDHDDDHGDHDG